MYASQYEELLSSLELLKRENNTLKSGRSLLLTEQQLLRNRVTELESLNETANKKIGVVKNLYTNTLCKLQEQQLLHDRICASYENQIESLQEDIAILEQRSSSLEGMLNAIFQDAREH